MVPLNIDNELTRIIFISASGIVHRQMKKTASASCNSGFVAIPYKKCIIHAFTYPPH